MNKITNAELKELLHYDPVTGHFTWLVSRGRAKVGKVAGSHDGQGYINITLSRRSYCAHRLAHLYMMGDWPEHDIDHEDLNKSNNKWLNLRPATGSQNEANKPLRSDNTLGYKGVYRAGNRFAAQIKTNGVKKHLGYFDSAYDAHQSYLAASNDVFGEFARAA